MLPFYDDVGILKRNRAFRNYVKTYQVETIDDKSLDDPLFLSKNSIKSLFNDLLSKKNGVKYNLSTKITLKKVLRTMKLNMLQFNLIEKQK